MDKKVSIAVVRRLPKYYRHLDELSSEGVARISSGSLAVRMGLTASQIRQDLNCFGGFGQQGYGYNVERLRDEIASILGLDRRAKAIMIGVGRIGKALLYNFDFRLCGFELVRAFDVSPDSVGRSFGGVMTAHIGELEEFVLSERPQCAVLTLPRENAATMASRLAFLGVKGIWNFTNVDLHLDGAAVWVENVHFADSLMTLCYRINE